MDFMLWVLYHLALASPCTVFITTLYGFIMVGYTPRNPLLAVMRGGREVGRIPDTLTLS